MGEIGKKAEVATATGYYSSSDLLDTSVAERGRLYNLLLTTIGDMARAMSKLFGFARGAAIIPAREAEVLAKIRRIRRLSV